MNKTSETEVIIANIFISFVWFETGLQQTCESSCYPCCHFKLTQADCVLFELQTHCGWFEANEIYASDVTIGERFQRVSEGLHVWINTVGVKGQQV